MAATPLGHLALLLGNRPGEADVVIGVLLFLAMPAVTRAISLLLCRVVPVALTRLSLVAALTVRP